MIALLLFLILAVIVAVVFANMATYVIGGFIGLLLLVFILIARRRKRP